MGVIPVSASGADSEQLLLTITSGELAVLGQVTDASNLAILAEIVDADPASTAPVRVIYKPVRGERPLWDFPTGTLAGREVATWLVARAGGWEGIAPTVLRDGPFGQGSVQHWIGDPFDDEPLASPVSLAPVGQVPEGWLGVVDGELPGGQRVTVVHEDAADLRSMSVLDAVVNNSDRKGSHLVRDAQGHLWGFDHGLSFHVDPKLRTVLWGWAGERLTPGDVGRLTRLRDQLDTAGSPLAADLAAVLPRRDVKALRKRVAGLLISGRHPQPSRGWPSIPWPAL